MGVLKTVDTMDALSDDTYTRVPVMTGMCADIQTALGVANEEAEQIEKAVRQAEEAQGRLAEGQCGQPEPGHAQTEGQHGGDEDDRPEL